MTTLILEYLIENSLKQYATLYAGKVFLKKRMCYILSRCGHMLKYTETYHNLV